MQFQVESYTPLELRYAFYECPIESSNSRFGNQGEKRYSIRKEKRR